MTRRGALLLLLTLCIACAGAVAYFLWSRSPALVQELRALAEIAGVQHRGSGRLTGIQLRDWHMAHGADVEEVAAVQVSQIAILRSPIAKRGVKAAYSEGLSRESMPDLE